jgi:hypothetical protein
MPRAAPTTPPGRSRLFFGERYQDSETSRVCVATWSSASVARVFPARFAGRPEAFSTLHDSGSRKASGRAQTATT